MKWYDEIIVDAHAEEERSMGWHSYLEEQPGRFL
jgi:hypothetical protein